MVHFSKFRLSGFKSFVDPTEVEIGPGLNGIVGPNGCGKSNLVEALRWVMGETSARKIRGDGMEDVIFAGTAQRPPRSAAEVSLLLDNSMLDAPEPFGKVQEIQITRRIERDKGSVYKVNGKTVRARDVQMLFADTVSGANSPALVSQGKITTIINAKPHERRHVLEESAGVAGLYTRRHEAELRLRAAESNLTRLNDGMASMRGQLGALKRQAGQAQKYRDLSEKIRKLEMLIAWAEWNTAHLRQKELTGAHDALETQIATAMGDVARHNTAHEKALTAIPDLRQADMKAHAALQAVRIELDRLAQDQDAARQALEQAQADLEQVTKDTQETQDTHAETAAALAGLTEEEKELDTRLAQMPQRIEGQKERLSALQAQLDKMERRYQEVLSAHAAKQAEAKQARQELDDLHRKETQTAHRLAAAQAELASLQHQQAQLGDLDEARKTRQSAQEMLDAMLDTIDAQEQDKDLKRAILEENQKSIQDLSSDYRLIEGEIKSITQLLQSLTADQGEAVMNAITVDLGFEKALARALGDLGLNAAPRDCADGADIYWDEASSSIAPPSGSGAEKTGLDLPCLLQFVKAPDVLHRALAMVFVADNASLAHSKAQSLRAGQSIVTKEGGLWRWDGLRIKPTAKTDTSGLSMEHKNRLALLEQEREKLAEKRATAESQVAQSEQSYMEAYEALRQSVSDRQKLEQDAKQATAALADLENRIGQITLRIDHAQEKATQIAADHHDIAESLAKAQSLQSEAGEEDRAKIEAEIKRLQDDMATQRDILNAQRSDYDVLTFQLKQDQERSDRIRTDKTVLEGRLEKLSQRVKELNSRHVEVDRRLAALQKNPVYAGDRQTKLADKIGQLETAAKASGDALAAAENLRSDLSKELRDAEHHLSAYKEKRAAIHAELSGLMGDVERMNESIRGQFQFPPAALHQKIADIFGDSVPPVEAARSDLIRFKHEREVMGPVNLRADQEAEEMSASLNTLEKEYDDLTEAIDQLRKGIAKLNKEAREKMREAFVQVNAHFQKLFVRLFNGGQAHLEMIESDDPLEAGLEIYAQPPGKALQSLSLLSGGEQTLTATALIFGMFLTNPSPICVLDEIDAPLDDSNVERVCDLLDYIAKNGRTRFMVITHHRMTMARMDRLYGVTMSEKGVSKLVSVDLATQQTMLDQLMA